MIPLASYIELPIFHYVFVMYYHNFNYESMVSLVLRQYMRGENGTENLVFFFSVLLIQIGKHNVNESAPGAKL